MVEIGIKDLILIIFLCGLLLVLATLSYFVIRRLRELHKERKTVQGIIFVSSAGDMFTEIEVPIDVLMQSEYLLMKIEPIAPKGGETNGIHPET
jgi:hypothetical protein